MSHDLTEVDAHTTPITVPDGTDSRSNAANVVEALAQALANRTHRLDLHTAKFDATNTWEQSQEFDIDQSDAPAIRSLTDAGDHSGSPTNIWKLQFEFLLTNGTKARLYSGDGTNGNWALTTNAVWDPAPGVQTWDKDDDAHESNVLRVFDGELHFFGKAAGAGSWGPGAWDGTRGVARVGDGVHALHVNAFEFLYEPPATRWVQLFPVGGWNTFNDRNRLAAGESQGYWLPRLPHDGTIGQVNAKIEPGATANYTIELHQSHSKSFSDTTTPGIVDTVHDSEVVSGAPSGVVNHTLIYPSLTINNEFDMWWVNIFCHVGSPASIDVYGVQLGFVDPGPRNH